MLQRAEPLWYQADSPELLQGSSVLLVDKDKWMAGCSFLCSLSQATGSFWWYWICCLLRRSKIQDLTILTLLVKSQAWRASATFSASTERGVYTPFWCQQTSIVVCAIFQLYNQALWDQRHLVHSCLWRLIAEQECEQESAHTWYNRDDVDGRYNWYNLCNRKNCTIKILTTFCRRSKNSNLVLLTSGTVYTCHEEDHYLVILSDWYSWGNSTLNITSIEHEPNMFIRMTTQWTWGWVPHSLIAALQAGRTPFTAQASL